MLRTTDDEIESWVVNILVAHHALSRNGIGFVKSVLKDESFVLLDALERAWRSPRPKPRAVWRLLRQLAEPIGRAFSDEEINALTHASSITVFSEFPVGLAILPDDSAPLCCRVPIAYRPLVPLIRALQLELSSSPTHYLAGQLNVLIAECIPTSDPVGRLSRVGWQAARDLVADVPYIRISMLEAGSPVDIINALHEDRYDILIVSAHGTHDGNRTGIVCGDRFVDGTELGDLPAIVCLSACQVSPRGSGRVNITDLFLRQGAYVVLGTMVPVDVRRNAILMTRFITNLAESLAGRMEYKTLAGLWSFVRSSNAFSDILSGNVAMYTWAHDRTHGRSVIEESMLERSVGRLRPNHIYKDSETILMEIARDRGVGHRMRSWLSSPGYLPESLFYVMLGWPERIFLYDKDFAEGQRWFEARVEAADGTDA